MSRCRSVLLAAASLALASGTASAAVLFDNTLNGTSYDPAYAANLSSQSREQGIRFSVGTGYSLSISSIKVFLWGGTGGFDITLWSSSYNGLLGGYITHQSVSTPNADQAWRSFTLGGSFSNLTEGEYILSLGYSSDPNLYVFGSANGTPSSIPGLTFLDYRESTSWGQVWSWAGNSTAIQMSGVLTPPGGGAVPMPGAAALAASGLLAAMRRRRR